jgi:two-component system, NtrC family, response regulator AtoC
MMHEGTVAAYDVPISGAVTIGRGSDCDIQIAGAWLSRQHFSLAIATNHVVVTDLGSSNGVTIAGTKLEANSPTEVSFNESIFAGPLEFVVQVFRRPTMDQRSTASPDRAIAKPATRSESDASMPAPVVVDPGMRRLYDLAARLARGDIGILVTGETGVGKEVMAEFIHRSSPRASRPLVRINCAALADSLVEAELFGHERGAFTGAQRERVGLLESANGGTVMLDEIGEISLSLQAKLLRVIEERQILRVGASQPRPVDIRFVAATNRDLEIDIERGTFRRDLFFRVAGAVLTIPPLRERAQEIELLARSFVAATAARLGTRPPRLSDATIDALRRRSWPGNARELRNVMERAVLLANDGEISAELLDLAASRSAAARLETKASHEATVEPVPSHVTVPLRDQLAEIERARIVETLDRHGGNQRLAAEELGIPLRTLINRIETYGLPRPRKG